MGVISTRCSVLKQAVDAAKSTIIIKQIKMLSY